MENEFYKAIVQNSVDILTVHDADGVMLYESPAAAHTLGRAPGKIVGKSPCEAIHPDDQARVRAAFSILVQGDTLSHPVQFRLRHASGKWIYLETVGTNLLGDSRIKGVLLNSRHVTGQKDVEERIAYLSQYDVLTGLPTRPLMLRRLREALRRAFRVKRVVALILMDLARFSLVNDSPSQAVGERLLKRVAERISACFREDDTVARLGDNAFAVVMIDVRREEDITRVLEKLLAALRQPFELDGHPLLASCHIGVGIYPRDGQDAETLVQNAEVALHRAKELASHGFQFYAADMTARMAERLKLEAALRAALEREELSLHFQPIVDTNSGTAGKVEALLRWEHPELGKVPPLKFIPIAEDTGLIISIGEWVLRQACRQCAEWQKAGIEAVCVAVNLSPKQFKQRDFVKGVVEALEHAGITPGHLELEVTETMLMEDIEDAAAKIAELQSRGVRTAIDDFGTGYSSLSYLKRLPVDALKIDRAFVKDITTDADSEVMVRTMIKLAHDLGLSAVAEGVETAEQYLMLSSHGCDRMQGYYFSRPLPAGEVGHLLGKQIGPAPPQGRLDLAR